MKNARVAWRVTSLVASTDRKGFAKSLVEFLPPLSTETLELKYIGSHASCQDKSNLYHIREYHTKEGDSILVAVGTSV